MNVRKSGMGTLSISVTLSAKTSPMTEVRRFEMSSDSATTMTSSVNASSTRGPGRTPCISIPARKTAIEPLPGTQSPSVGNSCPPSLASFADSGAMTPSMAPLPNISFCSADWTP